MRAVVIGESEIRLKMGGEGFDIVAEGAPVSPFHLLAVSLASCTALTVGSWADTVGIDVAPLEIRVRWKTVEERPARVERMEMDLLWSTLPPERVSTAARVAELCPIHATLVRGTEVMRRVLAGEAALRVA
jgi:uncharacterized OsmC-like protein